MQKKLLTAAFLFFGITSGVWAESWVDSLCPSSAPLASAENPADTSNYKTPSAQVMPQREWSLTLSPDTYHFSYNPDHRHVYLGGIEHYGTADRFCGAVLFRNSFGQPSTYVYFGKEWPNLMGTENWFAKVSGGLIYGYKDQFKNKIPFNQYGIAPAIIPSLGYKISQQDSLQLILLGNSALMFAYGHDF
jgi:hypothetical protein